MKLNIIIVLIILSTGVIAELSFKHLQAYKERSKQINNKTYHFITDCNTNNREIK